MLEGQELRIEIRRRKAEGESNIQIASALGCTRQYVSRIVLAPEQVALATTVKGSKTGRPPSLPPVTIPPDLLAKMIELLREGTGPRVAGVSTAYDAELLRLPGVAECFRVLDAERLGAKKLIARQRSAIRKFVSTGQWTDDSPASKLWQARQEGLLRRGVAA